jgi:hypothetical protein
MERRDHGQVFPAVRSEQSDDLAFADFEAEIAHRRLAPEDLRDLDQLEQGAAPSRDRESSRNSASPTREDTPARVAASTRFPACRAILRAGSGTTTQASRAARISVPVDRKGLIVEQATPDCLRCRSVTLRNQRDADIEDVVRWETIQTWWMLWDGPDKRKAEEPCSSPELRAERIRQRERERFDKPIPGVRMRFEVDGPTGTHLGWTNRYRLPDDLPDDPPDTGQTGDEEADRFAVGICLPDLERGVPGIGMLALALHSAYRFKMDACPLLYTETWSGNLSMIGLAARLGFEECRRLTGVRLIRGRAYDSLRFVLDRRTLWSRCSWLEDSVPSLI